MEAIRKKLGIMGDEACGKTSLFIAFVGGIFSQDNVPRVFEDYVADVEINGKQVELTLLDTAAHEEDDRLRPLFFSTTNVLVICFAIDYPESLESVKKKWISEVSLLYSRTPFLLVGCKKDLRNDPETVQELKKKSQHPVTFGEGERTARRIGALKYLECSAKTGEGVHDVFKDATLAALTAKRKRQPGRPCIHL